MVELRIEVPKELEEEIEEFPENWSEIALEAIKSKLFLLQLSKSKELQRAVFEALSAKSRLTESDALKLGKEINKSLHKRYKKLYPGLE